MGDFLQLTYLTFIAKHSPMPVLQPQSRTGKKKQSQHHVLEPWEKPSVVGAKPGEKVTRK